MIYCINVLYYRNDYNFNFKYLLTLIRKIPCRLIYGELPLAIFAQYFYIERVKIFFWLLFSTAFPTLRISICFSRSRRFHVNCRRSYLHAFTHKILYNNERTRAK